MSWSNYIIEPGEMATPEAIDRKRKMAQMLALKGSDTSPVGHWSQGAARIVDALSGGLEDLRASALEKNSSKFAQSALDGIAGALGGGGSAAASPAAGGAPVASGGDYFSTMAQKESGGNPNARNPSGATGLYQFMPGTWRGLMEKNPNLGLTYEGITDPQQQQVAMRQFTQDNAAVLSKAGVPVNNATLALAHQQGAGGAIKLLSNPDAPAASIVGAKAVTANGGNLDMTAGQFAQHVTNYYGYGNTNPQALAGQGEYQNTPSTPQQAPAGQYANADMPEAGAQPVQYQPPGGQPAPQQGGMTRVQAIMQLSKAWPYMNDAQRQQAQMYINAMPQAKDPTQAALEQEQLTKARNENSLFPQQQQKLLQDLAGGSPIDIQGKQLGMQKTQAELGQIGKTGDINEYEYAKRSGAFTGTFPEYQKMIAEAKRSQVNIDQRAENAEEMARGQGMGKRLNEIADEGGKAQEDAVMFQRFGQLLGNVETGGKTALLEGIRQMTNGTVTLDPNVDNVQALNAAVQYLAPRLRVPGTGAQSDAELRNFMNSVPTLAGQPGGNKIILDSLQGLVKYKLQRAEIAQAWQSGEISGKEATKQIQSLPSPFANLPKVEEPKNLPTSSDGWQDAPIKGYKIRQVK